MSHYNVNAIRLDASHHVTNVQWARIDSSCPMDYQFTDATVLEVVNALNKGDDVCLELKYPEYTVDHGCKFRVVSYPDGKVGVDIDGFTLTELPTF